MQGKCYFAGVVSANGGIRELIGGFAAAFCHYIHAPHNVSCGGTAARFLALEYCLRYEAGLKPHAFV